MSKLVLVTADDPDALLRAAAAPFCSSTSRDLPLLALRQGGLRDAVYEMAAAGGSPGWLGRPVVVFGELPTLFAGDRKPLSALEREAVITRILGEPRLAALGLRRARRTLALALDRLFGDLMAEGVAPEDLATGLSRLAGDAWGERRNDDIRLVYTRYVDRLETLERTDGRDGLLLAAQAIAAAGEGPVTGLRRPFEATPAPRSVDIYGLADLRLGWRRFLEALVASPAVDELRIHLLDGQAAEVRRWTEKHEAELRVAPATRTVVAPLAALRGAVLGDSASMIPSSPAITVTAAPDITRELEDVARSVKRLLLEGHTDGHPVAGRDIAIIARQSRPYLTRAAEIFERYGIPTHARLRHTLSEVPAVAALLRVFRAATDEWSTRRLRELSDSPYFEISFDMPLLREVGGSARRHGIDGWRDALAAPAAGEPDDDAERVARRARRIEDALAQFEVFAAAARQLAGARPLAAWIDTTIEMIGGSLGDAAGFLGYASNILRPPREGVPRVLRDAARVDAAALRKMVELLQSWRDAATLAYDREPHAVGEWLLQFERALSDEEISVRTGERGGVQLVEASAAEGQRWAHVFVVGMSTGNFPAEPARDILLADAERQRLNDLGLPVEPADIWRARESALFRGLVNAPSSSLRLSYSCADASGTPQLPSAYLDDVIGRIAGDASSWMATIPGSRVVSASPSEIWSADEAIQLGAQATRDAAGADAAAQMLGAAAASGANAAAVSQLLHATSVERVRVAARTAAGDGVSREELAHAWNGRIDDPMLLVHLRDQFGERVWSATQLESYGRCGFTFFGKYVLRVDEPEQDEEDDLSARDAGSVMHEALGRTYERLRATDPHNPLSLRHVDAAFSIVAEEVRRAFDAIGVKGGDGLHAARSHETTVLLQQYLKWEMKRNDGDKAPMRPEHMELGFGLDDGDLPPATLEWDGRPLRLRGRIDRVDTPVDGSLADYRYVVDHKSGASAFVGLGALQRDGALLQLELYLAALDQILPGAKLWGGAYQLIRGRKCTAALERCSVDGKGNLKELGTATQRKHDERIRDAARLALSLVDGILAGRFAARVPDGTKCLAYCQFRDACREATFGGTWSPK